jgi:hypothetical protein
MKQNRLRSIILDVQHFRGSGCDNDHDLVDHLWTETVSKKQRVTQMFHTEIFSLKKLNEVDGKEKNEITISNGSQSWKT